MKRIPQAVLTLALVVPLWPQSAELREAAEALQRGDYVRARRAGENAVRAEPRSATARRILGMAFAAENRLEEALPQFSRACDLNAREPNACYYLGRTAYYLSRLDEAESAFRAAIGANASKERSRLGLALVLEVKGNPDEAETLFKQAVADKVEDAERSYGLFLYRRARGEEAVKMLERAGATEDLARVRAELAAASDSIPPNPAAASANSPIRFQVTELPMTVKNGAFGNKHLVETMMGGVAVIDFDNDSYPDIFITNGAEIPSLTKPDDTFANRLFRNRGDGTFEDVTSKAGVQGSGYSMGAAAGDFDGDGWTDLFVVGVRGNSLYRNLGDGCFADATESAGVGGDGRWSVAAAWLDYDKDGRLDLLVLHYVVWDPAKEPFCGDERPGHRAYCHPKLYEPLPNLLFRNEGNGRFRDVSAETGIGKYRGKGMGLAVADYDNDGWLDVFVGNDTMPNFLFHNRNGVFEEVATESGVALPGDGRPLSSMGAAFGDFDRDGNDDLAVTALSNETFPLFRNLGDGQFQDVTTLSGIAAQTLPYSGWGVGFVDLDNDGLLDIFTANGHVMDNAELTSSRASKQPNSVLRNQGGQFSLQLLPVEPAFHRGAAFADFDRDGRMDVVVSRLNQSPVVLRNVTENSAHWLAVHLEGNPVGARIRLQSKGGTQWRSLATAYSYASSSEPLVHFGLGADAVAEELEVTWPDGCVQLLTSVPADQHLRVSRSCE